MKSKLDFKSWPETPDEDVLKDYIDWRKIKKAPLTQSIVRYMSKTLHKYHQAGYNIDDVLCVSLSRGWLGITGQWFLTALMEYSDNDLSASNPARSNANSYRDDNRGTAHSRSNRDSAKLYRIA